MLWASCTDILCLLSPPPGAQEFFSPQYYEIWKYKEVCGISLWFLAVDISGGVFSTLSLVFKAKFEIVPGVSYAIVMVSH